MPAGSTPAEEALAALEAEARGLEGAVAAAEPERRDGTPATHRILGFDVGSPLGVPASPLTASAAMIELLHRRGFGVLTHKTVRGQEWPEHPAPNWIYLPEATEPLSAHAADSGETIATGGSGAIPRDLRNFSSANSYGVPSLAPAVWQRDLEEALGRIDGEALLIASVQGSPEVFTDARDLVEDYTRVARLAAGTGVAAVELNLSCPNTVDFAGERLPPVCASPVLSRRIVEAVRGALGSEVRLLVKLSYLSRESLDELLAPIAPALDAVSGINTVPLRIVDETDGQPLFRGTPTDPDRPRDAGVSGAALRSLALDFVEAVAGLRARSGWNLEILGMGGVLAAEDAAALLDAGAEAVQTATGALHPGTLPGELAELLARRVAPASR